MKHWKFYLQLLLLLADYEPWTGLVDLHWFDYLDFHTLLAPASAYSSFHEWSISAPVQSWKKTVFAGSEDFCVFAAAVDVVK